MVTISFSDNCQEFDENFVNNIHEKRFFDVCDQKGNYQYERVSMISQGHLNQSDPPSLMTLEIYLKEFHVPNTNK